MHERSLITGLIHRIEGVLAANGATRAVGVKVRLGALSNISADHFREHFVNETPGTVADGARLEVEVMDDPTDPRAQEIILESVDIEDA